MDEKVPEWELFSRTIMKANERNTSTETGRIQESAQLFQTKIESNQKITLISLTDVSQQVKKNHNHLNDLDGRIQQILALLEKKDVKKK